MISIKRIKNILVIFCAALFSLICGCSDSGGSGSGGAYIQTFTRAESSVDYSGIAFTSWDVPDEAVPVHQELPYTIMVYMNGSDLESENGAATLDMLEMLDSGVDTELINIIIFTGGTYRWQNNVVPPNDCVVWRLERGGLSEIAGVGLRNMGDPGTLSSFIKFSASRFPAEKYGLIFWDHGGGSIAGYGHDELFANSRLTLLEIDYALKMAGFGNKLEFLGFDSCLMATIEMAVVASEYARYLIASEDLEPGDGWDYSFLSELSENPQMDGAALGRAVTDYYMSYYGLLSRESLTMSVTDLSAAGRVMGAMGALMSRCASSLAEGGEGSFTTLAQRRNRTKSFGDGSSRGGDSDMVDIGDMAARLTDLYPAEASALDAALKSAVIYNRHNSFTRLGGLTAYYIFGGKDDAENTLGTYDALSMSEEYTGYLREFANIMTGGVPGSSNRSAAASEDDNILDVSLTVWTYADEDGIYRKTGQKSVRGLLSEKPELWPVISGSPVCMDEIGSSSNGVSYAIPASVNGMDADIIVLVSEQNPRGEVLGYRREDGYVIQKGLDGIEAGDSVSFYYTEKSFDGGPRSDSQRLSDAIPVTEPLTIEWHELPPADHFLMLSVIDAHRNETLVSLGNAITAPQAPS